MAYFLQGLILLALAAPFSHRVHLQLGLDCLKCHPTAPASQSPADNNLPVEQTCKPCHSEPRTINAPRATTVTRFSHARHVKLGNPAPVILAAIRGKTYLAASSDKLVAGLTAATTSCTACHRGLDKSDHVDASAYPAMADCLVCHPKIDPPFSCEQCHSPGAHLKPASHTPDFFDSHSLPKLPKTGCALCHGVRFTCQGCH